MERKKMMLAATISLALAAAGGTSIAVYADNGSKKADKLKLVEVKKPDLPKETIVLNPSNANYTVEVLIGTEDGTGTGATKRFDTEVLPYIGERQGETKALLGHSYRLIDAYLIGSAEVEGLGDFAIDPFTTEKMLTDNYNTFKALYADELTRGAAVVEELTTYTDGPLPWNKHNDGALLQIVMKIDEAYRGAIDNLSWSNTEQSDGSGIDEEKEFALIRQLDADTRFMKARDVFQRYHTWLFGGKFEVEGIVREDNQPRVDDLLTIENR